VFSTNADLNYKLIPEERGILRLLHLEDFISSVPWGVLHPQLVKETIASLEPTTWSTTVKGESIIIVAKNWRTQFQEVFHLTSRKEQTVNKEWQVEEMFPSSKGNSTKQDTVRISDCQYPGSKKPLRLLSSLLCLNPAHQHHIAISFAEHILDALNGKAIDWPQEFHREMTEELIALPRYTSSHPKARRQRLGNLKIFEETRRPKNFEFEGRTWSLRDYNTGGPRNRKARRLEDLLNESKDSKT
jgi:hypothetical protein